MLRFYKIREHERGLLFKDGALVDVLKPGLRVALDPLFRLRLDRASVRDVWLVHRDLDLIARSDLLDGDAEVIDLGDRERALVWVDGRFETLLGPGLHVVWTELREVRVERVGVGEVRFVHPELERILKAPAAGELLNVFMVEPGHSGVYFLDGKLEAVLGPGRHAFWRGAGKVTVHLVDGREVLLDVAGQEIMTADKVTLRLNATLAYRVTDPARATTAVDDHRQALYRRTQLALREVVGTRELDQLLADKDAVASELEATIRERAVAIGVEVAHLGIRDVILPGEMKELLNKVTEAKKAAEAAVITRREETAAMRSQANTAKLLEQSPTLMRLRELEVLEKVAEKADLTVVLGEKGLAERVTKLL